MKKLLMLFVASAALVGSAGAQDARSDAVACRDTAATAGLYRRCALWDDGKKIRRGEDGAVVADVRFFRPIAVTRVVSGDSAMAYAKLYERRSMQGGVLAFAGGLLMAGGVALLANSDCHSTYFTGCNSGNSVGWALYVPGAVTMLTGGITLVRAKRAKGKAIWWNNERFARP